MASNEENNYFNNEKNRKTAQFRFHLVDCTLIYLFNNVIENDISD